jgi:ribosomal-protein-alanine N-acetyltransferase
MVRIHLKPVTRSDGPELIDANVRNRDYHSPWVQPFTDLQGFEDWFGAIATGANIGLIAREEGGGSIVGVVNCNQIFLKGFQSAYLGYYGMSHAVRQGFMTEALRLAIRYAFDEVGLHRLEANIQPANHPSIALVQRLNFRREGFSPRYLRIGNVWCDHERWALLADDPASGTSG